MFGDVRRNAWNDPMEAYVVHVDMVSREEVGFKLTKETISTLEGLL